MLQTIADAFHRLLSFISNAPQATDQLCSARQMTSTYLIRTALASAATPITTNILGNEPHSQPSSQYPSSKVLPSSTPDSKSVSNRPLPSPLPSPILRDPLADFSTEDTPIDPLRVTIESYNPQSTEQARGRLAAIAQISPRPTPQTTPSASPAATPSASPKLATYSRFTHFQPASNLFYYVTQDDYQWYEKVTIRNEQSGKYSAADPKQPERRIDVYLYTLNNTRTHTRVQIYSNDPKITQEKLVTAYKEKLRGPSFNSSPSREHV